MMDARLRAGVDMMLRVGGSFERALAQAAIECEDGHEFIRCLVAAHKVAHGPLRTHLTECFVDCGLFSILEWSSFDRLQILTESFPGTFERHIAMAEATA